MASPNCGSASLAARFVSDILRVTWWPAQFIRAENTLRSGRVLTGKCSTASADSKRSRPFFLRKQDAKVRCEKPFGFSGNGLLRAGRTARVYRERLPPVDKRQEMTSGVDLDFRAKRRGRSLPGSKPLDKPDSPRLAFPPRGFRPRIECIFDCTHHGDGGTAFLLKQVDGLKPSRDRGIEETVTLEGVQARRSQRAFA